jgi:hypothetical protein
MHHAEFIAHTDLIDVVEFVSRLPMRPKLFKACIASIDKPAFYFNLRAIDMAHALKECEPMLLAGDSLTVEALQS